MSPALTFGGTSRKISKMTLTGFAVTAAPAYPDSQIVKVTDGDEQPVTFKRSVADASAEVAAIASELERHEAAVTRHYRAKRFCWGFDRRRLASRRGRAENEHTAN